MYLTNAYSMISSWPVASKPTLMDNVKWTWVLERSLRILIVPRERKTHTVQEGNSFLSVTGLHLSRWWKIRHKALRIFPSRLLPPLMFCLTYQILLYQNTSTLCLKRLRRMDNTNYVVWVQSFRTLDPIKANTSDFLIKYLEKSML